MYRYLFAKPGVEIYKKDELEKERIKTNKENETKENPKTTILHAHQVADWYANKGMSTKSKMIRNETQKMEAEVQEKKNLSFRNPDNVMIKKAREFGIDLKDARVKDILEEIHEQKCRNKSIHGWQNANNSHENQKEKTRILMTEIIMEMNKNELYSALNMLSRRPSLFQSKSNLRKNLVDALFTSDENIVQLKQILEHSDSYLFCRIDSFLRTFFFFLPLIFYVFYTCTRY